MQITTQTIYELAKKLGYEPNNKQIEALNIITNNQISAHRWARRFGKSHIFSTTMTAYLLPPKAEGCIIAPTLKLTDIIFNKTINNFLTLGLKPKTLNHKEKIVGTQWDSYLYAATFKNIRQVLGRSYDFFLIDETALLDTEDLTFFYQDIMPTLLEKNGKFACISTPRNKKQVFYKFCSEFISTHATIYDQKHIPIEEIEKLKKYYENNPNVWKQEFLAEFVDIDKSNVFNWYPNEYCIIDSQLFGIDLQTKEKQTNTQNNTKITPLIIENEEVYLKDLTFFIGLDTGYIHPTAISVIGVLEREKPYFFIVDTFKKAHITLREIADVVNEFIYKYDPMEFYADPANRQLLEELAVEYDLSFKPAKKDVETILNFMHSIDLYVNVNMDFYRDFKDEWIGYTQKNGIIVKRNDDLIDSIKYALYNCYLDFYYGTIDYNYLVS